MKARLLPIYFESAQMDDFYSQIEILKDLLSNEAEILSPIPLGSLVQEADAILFPQLVGEAFSQIDKIKRLGLPIIIITSEFGTVAMWDWEIVTFLKSKGLKIFVPYSLELTKTICRAFALKREMKQTRFLVFQDNPGEGMQASIFKRFFWWEDECTQRISERFGIGIEKRSFKKLADDAKRVSDREAQEVLRNRNLHIEGVESKSLLSAAKMYVALKHEVGGDISIRGAGINCLNESFYSDTTPCLAWQMLFEDKKLMWACEADTMSLLTQYIVYSSLKQPVMTSNVYPFLIGMAALKHEKINAFPEVEQPENYLLIAHCGFFGLMPACFSSDWTLKPKVLTIVDDNATAVDARFPQGSVTLAKLHPSLDKLQVVNGNLDRYVQYPDSDCKNGGLIKVRDGHKLMNSFYSHHSCIITGNQSVELGTVAKVLDLDFDEI